MIFFVKKNASRWNDIPYRKTDKKKWQFGWFGSYAIKNTMAGAMLFLSTISLLTKPTPLQIWAF
jgi:hypothetical protein